MYAEDIKKATHYIQKMTSNDVYGLAIASYALQLAGGETKDVVLQKLRLNSCTNGKKMPNRKITLHDCFLNFFE